MYLKQLSKRFLRLVLILIGLILFIPSLILAPFSYLIFGNGKILVEVPVLLILDDEFLNELIP